MTVLVAGGQVQAVYKIAKNIPARTLRLTPVTTHIDPDGQAGSGDEYDEAYAEGTIFNESITFEQDHLYEVVVLGDNTATFNPPLPGTAITVEDLALVQPGASVAPVWERELLDILVTYQLPNYPDRLENVIPVHNYFVTSFFSPVEERLLEYTGDGKQASKSSWVRGAGQTVDLRAYVGAFMSKKALSTRTLETLGDVTTWHSYLPTGLEPNYGLTPDGEDYVNRFFKFISAADFDATAAAVAANPVNPVFPASTQWQDLAGMRAFASNTGFFIDTNELRGFIIYLSDDHRVGWLTADDATVATTKGFTWNQAHSPYFGVGGGVGMEYIFDPKVPYIVNPARGPIEISGSGTTYTWRELSTAPLGTTPITVTTRPLSLVVMDYGKVTFS